MIMALLQLLLFILILVYGGSSSRPESVVTGTRIKVGNETDRLSLLDIKKRIIDQYGALSSWNNSIHFCNWIGVSCGHRHQRVIGLNLNGKGLGGNISPSIGNLSFLHLLDIATNNIHGEIPQQIGKLIRLQLLNFTDNTLQGELPTSLANCTHLREIHFSHNNLVGKIPAELTSLSKLEFLSINVNGLTGELPASLGNMSYLRVISLGENALWGRIPESLSLLTNLYGLSLVINKLSGMFPFSIYNLSSLKILSLAGNRLQGNLPQDIGLKLLNLQYLGVEGNLFSRSIPNSISNISTLVELDLGDNNFVGPIPDNLGNLQNLQFFSIGENQCGAGEADDLGFVNSLVNCTNLERLFLNDNGFKGPLPNFIANFSPQLSKLILGGNQISGTIPAGIENLVGLTLLDMDQNYLEGNIPSGIGKLPRLQILDLSGNRLSGQIPSSIGNLTLLFELHLQHNNLNATIPFSLGNCQKLQYLNLAHNNLQGPIPKQLFHISSLSISLNLSCNSLVGSLPEDIGNLKSLSTMDISKNRLFGEIPSSIGDCNSLEHLYMGSNLFEGMIPQSLTLLKGLQDLDLSHNNLSKKIPKDLENLSALQSLNLSFNNLEGEVPTKGVFGNASAVFVNGNDKLCGGIAELHLPVCTNHGSTKGKKFHALRIVLAVLISAVLSILFISSLFTLYWTRKSKSKPPSTPLIGDQFLKISYKQLFQATGGFSSTNFIGSGSFGSVYKGIINNGETIVAVKVLNLENSIAYKSFMTECEALRNIRHRNLVKILTSCSSSDSKGKDFKALVYEFMPNGSLDDWLHLPMKTHNHSSKLNFFQSLNIAIDVASALEYLHCHCYAPIVHCDLKPSNVLLDSDMTAHVSDFGLARLLLEPDNNSSQTQSSTIGIKGSIGYVAPEYGMGGKATIEGDVFSYGILLLEMFTGKRPTDQIFTDEFNLHKFAKAALSTHVMNFLYPTLLPKEEYGEEIEEEATNKAEGPSHRTHKLQNCVMSVIEIALQCSKDSPRERINMNNVVKELRLIKGSFLGARIY